MATVAGGGVFTFSESDTDKIAFQFTFSLFRAFTRKMIGIA